jgi:hypothetical protein
MIGMGKKNTSVAASIPCETLSQPALGSDSDDHDYVTAKEMKQMLAAAMKRAKSLIKQKKPPPYSQVLITFINHLYGAFIFLQLCIIIMF